MEIFLVLPSSEILFRMEMRKLNHILNSYPKWKIHEATTRFWEPLD